MIFGAAQFYSFFRNLQFRLHGKGSLSIVTILGLTVAGKFDDERFKFETRSYLSCFTEDTISEQLERFERIEVLQVSDLLHQRPAFKESSSTAQIKVVYDSSAKTSS